MELVRQVAAGLGQSIGGDHADGAGGQTDHDLSPTAGWMAHAGVARRRTVPSRNA
jgi:hypothetical protein